MSDREDIHQYLVTLDRYLSRLNKTDAFEVVREIESHIYDVIDQAEVQGKVVNTREILEGFGPPRELAESYIRHIELGTPPPAGLGAIRTVKRQVSRVLFWGMAIFGFSFSVTLLVTAILNLFFPDSVGVWSSAGGESLIIGFASTAELPADQEVAGFWYTPIALVIGAITLWLTLGILKVLKIMQQQNSR